MQGKVDARTKRRRPPVYVGIDVCKAWTRRLHPSGWPEALRVRQQSEGLKRLKRSPRRPYQVRCSCMEATGKFHRAGPPQPPCRRLRRRRRQSVALAAVRRGTRHALAKTDRVDCPNAGDPFGESLRPDSQAAAAGATSCEPCRSSCAGRDAASPLGPLSSTSSDAADELGRRRSRSSCQLNARLRRRIAKPRGRDRTPDQQPIPHASPGASPSCTSIPGFGTVTAIAAMLIGLAAELGSLIGQAEPP